MRHSFLLSAAAYLAACNTAWATPTPATPAWLLSFEQLMSSLKVDASQTNTTGEQIATSKTKSMEAAMSTVTRQQQNMDLAKIAERYSYDTGQGYKACDVTASAADVTAAGQTRDEVFKKLSDIDNTKIMDGTSDAAQNIASALQLRSEVYCSEEEASAFGSWCSNGAGANGYPAGNSDTKYFLSNRSYGAEEVMTGLDYIDVLASYPTIEPTSSAKSAAQALSRYSAIRSSAVKSGARSALYDILLDGMAGKASDQGSQ